MLNKEKTGVWAGLMLTAALGVNEGVMADEIGPQRDDKGNVNLYRIEGEPANGNNVYVLWQGQDANGAPQTQLLNLAALNLVASGLSAADNPGAAANEQAALMVDGISDSVTAIFSNIPKVNEIETLPRGTPKVNPDLDVAPRVTQSPVNRNIGNIAVSGDLVIEGDVVINGRSNGVAIAAPEEEPGVFERAYDSFANTIKGLFGGSDEEKPASNRNNVVAGPGQIAAGGKVTVGGQELPKDENNRVVLPPPGPGGP